MMKLSPRFFVAIIFLLLLTFPLYAANFLTSSLNEGIGVRSLGMGGAFTAVADDANAIFYNPAGLAQSGISYHWGNLDLKQTQYTQAANGLFTLGPLGYSNWGVRDKNGNEVNVATYAFGQRAGFGFNWGIAYKKVNALSSGVRNDGWSGDIGILGYITPQLKLGIVEQDIIKESLDLASTFKLGLGYYPWGEQTLIAVDYLSTVREPAVFRYGLETQFMPGMILRFGWSHPRINYGISIDIPFTTLEYTTSNRSEEPFDIIHRFGLKLQLTPRYKRVIPLIGPKEIALIEIGGTIVGGRDEFSLLGGAKKGADNLFEEIKAARKDEGIGAIFLRIRGFNESLSTFAVVQEMRQELERAKKEGKKIFTYIDDVAGVQEYYLASISDYIICPERGWITTPAVAIEVKKLADLFGKIGIEWQILAKGKYKTALDPLSPKLTKDQENEIIYLVNSLYDQMLRDISASRKIDIEKLRQVSDGRLLSGQEAKELRLIDELGFYADAVSACGRIIEAGEEPRIIRSVDLLQENIPYFAFPFEKKIGVVEIDGTIITGSSDQNILFGGRYIGSDTVSENIRQIIKDDSIKAIVVRVNSPGGSDIASEQIYRALLKAKEKGKIIIASFGNVSASGGYYIASAADKIIANPSTITGSIGVFGSIPALAELYKKIGVDVKVIKQGEHADMFFGSRKLSDEEVKNFQDRLDDSYNAFIKAVSRGRKMPEDKVSLLAEGRVYTGTQAKKNGLVDKLGNFSDALSLAAEMANIRGEPVIAYYREPGRYLFRLGGGVQELLNRMGLYLWK